MTQPCTSNNVRFIIGGGVTAGTTSYALPAGTIATLAAAGRPLTVPATLTLHADGVDPQVDGLTEEVSLTGIAGDTLTTTACANTHSGPTDLGLYVTDQMLRGLLATADAYTDASVAGITAYANAAATAAQNAAETFAASADTSVLSTAEAYTDTVTSTKANKGANSDITSIAGLTTPLSTSQGGTGEAGTFTGLRMANSAGADTQATAGADYVTPGNVTADLAAFPGSANIVTVGALVAGTIPAANVVGLAAAVQADQITYTADETTLHESVGHQFNLILPAALGSSTAITQSPGDNSTKLSTTAYANAAIATATAAVEALIPTADNITLTEAGTVISLASTQNAGALISFLGMVN